MKVIAPELETIPERCPEPDLLVRAILAGDFLLCAPPEQRDALAPAGVPSWAELEALAAHIGAIPARICRSQWPVPAGQGAGAGRTVRRGADHGTQV